jgi:hypothetical protein
MNTAAKRINKKRKKFDYWDDPIELDELALILNESAFKVEVSSIDDQYLEVTYDNCCLSVIRNIDNRLYVYNSGYFYRHVNYEVENTRKNIQALADKIKRPLSSKAFIKPVFILAHKKNSDTCLGKMPIEILKTILGYLDDSISVSVFYQNGKLTCNQPDSYSWIL